MIYVIKNRFFLLLFCLLLGNLFLPLAYEVYANPVKQKNRNLALPLPLSEIAKIDHFSLTRSSLIRIEVNFFSYSYNKPWDPPNIGNSLGTGFIISGQRILTNAHVVSNANIIRVKRVDQKLSYYANVKYIAHDCDLAILEVEDPSFFKDAVALEIGEIPRLNTPVDVIGFPLGGNRISVTKGIVSRIDLDVYSHSRVDSHLTIQVDAAINPGNSGGPALQNGKVIGIAFQAYSQGENLGYLIPTNVIQRFLKDIRDEKYDGYSEFGVMSLPTNYPALSDALGLKVKKGREGILIYDIIPNSSAFSHLKPGDILLELNGRLIFEEGEMEIYGELHNYIELIDNLNEGDPIKVKILRNKKEILKTFPSKITKVLQFHRRNYDDPPSYAILGGLLFQPLDADLFANFSSVWLNKNRMDILYRYQYFLQSKIYEQTKVDVVLTGILNDKINSYAGEYTHRIVSHVNRKKITGFKDFTQKVKSSLKKNKYLVLNFYNIQVPLVFRSKEFEDATKRILKTYGVPKAILLNQRHF